MADLEKAENTITMVSGPLSTSSSSQDFPPVLSTMSEMTSPPPVLLYNSEKPTVYASSSSSDSEIEIKKQAAEGRWQGYQEEVLPEKTQGRKIRNLRHQIMSIYRRLFSLIFIANIGVFVATLVQGQFNAPHLGLVVIANLFCSILMRQEYVINGLFTLFCAAPLSWPLTIRHMCAQVYHLGGFHSGCGVSGTIWLILFTVRATIDVANKQKTSVATLAITYCILLLLLFMVAFAYPVLRAKLHDSFEMTHRFMGWTVTALVWAQIISLTNDYRTPGETLGHALVHSAPFWLVVVLTASIILPWLRLQKVVVRAEVLSSHAVRFYFDYGIAPPEPGSFMRVSKAPLTEWHSFATIAEPGKSGYSMVVSKAGDWTTKQIADPPTELWVRGLPTLGVMRVACMFRRVILVATGSGIGPITPVLLKAKVPYRLLWTAPNVRQTFGDKLVNTVLSACPDAVIYDTRTHGKPDMIKLTYKLVREFDAEAVVIISNPTLTYKVVYGLNSRGIPAFGAIWDS